MMDGLCEKIEGALTDAINPDQLEQDVLDAIENNDPIVGSPTNPIVPMCYAESITSQVIASSQEEIDSANNNLIDNLNAYLEDMNEMLAGIEGYISDIQNLIPDISGLNLFNVFIPLRRIPGNPSTPPKPFPPPLSG